MTNVGMSLLYAAWAAFTEASLAAWASGDPGEGSLNRHVSGSPSVANTITFWPGSWKASSVFATASMLSPVGVSSMGTADEYTALIALWFPSATATLWSSGHTGSASLPV